MSEPKTAVVSVDACPVARTIDGIEFDPAEWYWHIPTAHGNVAFNFNFLPGATESLRLQVRDAFAVLLLANAPERLGRLLVRFRALFKFLSAKHSAREIDELTAADLENYGASLPMRRQYFLRQVKWILIRWAKTGVGGLS